MMGAIIKNLYDSIDSYCYFYKLVQEGGINEISIDSLIKYLDSKGIHYDENSETS